VSELTVIDARGLPVAKAGAEMPVYLGIWGLVVIESMVVGTLLSSYFYLRLDAPEWPPAGVKPPDLLLPTLNTLVLLASGVAVHLADKAARKGQQARLKGGLGAGVVLALVFLTVKVVEYAGVDYRWDSHAYGSIVWTITGFHFLHVITLVLKTLVVGALALRGYWGAERFIGVQVNGIYWQFVVVIWLPIYAVLYWAPRVL
jgi:heme/copper-type cytochrome/quinol oxidase subunit 3